MSVGAVTRQSAAVAAPSGGMAIRCEGVVHLYRTLQGHDVVALQGVDLTIGAGERIALLGPSGSGKSTLLTLFGGIQRPSAGRVLLDDHDIARMNERELTDLRALKVSTMLQGATRNLLRYATATQNIAFAQMVLPRSRRAVLSSPAELLDRVRLSTSADRVVASMSGGERQRLALACAVAGGPSLLLADEPTSQLNHDDRVQILELIHAVGSELGTTIVVVTHDPDVAATFPRTVTIRAGRVGLEGRGGAEFVVIGADGMLQLPRHLVDEWPQGTMVRIEPDDSDLVLRRNDREPDEGPGDLRRQP